MSEKMSAEKELEEQLMEAGSKLLERPSSVDELLPLLDQAENFLSRVEQSPAESMQAALSPLTKALAADELLKHSDVDVKVSVASCISEITRITAPDAPYDDDKMKEVFQLIVSSFEDLSDKSSRSYAKRAQILETVAKVRSCVVMLDLECDGLIAEMFQLLLAMIRDYHPEGIFSSMETIMTVVLEESEDISPELLLPLLACVKKDDQEVLPIASKLAEKVFENCAVKLKPYLSQAIKSLDMSLDGYSSVVASVCQRVSSTGDSITEDASAEQSVLEDNSARMSTEEAQKIQLAKDKSEVCPDDVDANVKKSPNIDNGVNTGNGKHGRDRNVELSVDKKEHDLGDRSSTDKVVSKPEMKHAAKKRGSKHDSSTNISESSDVSHVGGEKEEVPDVQDDHGKDVPGSLMDDTAVEAAKPLAKESFTNQSSPKVPEDEVADVASPSLTGIMQDENQPKKTGRPKRKESSIQEEETPVDSGSKKAAEASNDSEAKSRRHAGKKQPADPSNEDLMSAEVDTSKNDGGGTSDSETKQIKELDKKEDGSFKIGDGLSAKKPKDGRKRGRGKAYSENDMTKSSAKDDIESLTKSHPKSAKDEGFREEIPRSSTKRKRIAVGDKASETLEYGENLVGAKVKVWWPKDREFYEGVIQSFDPIKKKHNVFYTDGDKETLNLVKERWKFVDGDADSSEEQAAEQATSGAASGMLKRKKAKTTPESSAKHGRAEGLPKSGTASSTKSKGTATKSGRKSKDDDKVEPKLKDRTSKAGAKSVDDISGKSKSQNTSGKKADDSSKASIKSKDVDSTISETKSKQETPKITGKSKQDSPKKGSKSKGKTSQAAADTSSTGMGKAKFSSSKTKEAGDLKEKSKEKSHDSSKASEGVKVKSIESKAQDTETVSLKKRRRGS